MCTAIADGALFGRTLDLENTYGEEVVITGRRFPFKFIYEGLDKNHLAIIGTAHIDSGVPLYYDAMNESGLCAAALRFPQYSFYHDESRDGVNLASFELIPWILCNFKSVKDAQASLKRVTITRDSFSPSLPAGPLHWIITDENESIIVESVSSGIRIYSSHEGVLTNAPDYPAQRENLRAFGNVEKAYSHISTKTLDLPGDSSSISRFVRAVYAKSHITLSSEGVSDISQFFHIMDAVTQPHGYAQNDDGAPIRTVYTSCMDIKELVYYFTTYTDRQIRAVRLKNIENDTLARFSMRGGESISYLN